MILLHAHLHHLDWARKGESKDKYLSCSINIFSFFPNLIGTGKSDLCCFFFFLYRKDLPDIIVSFLKVIKLPGSGLTVEGDPHIMEKNPVIWAGLVWLGVQDD